MWWNLWHIFANSLKNSFFHKFCTICMIWMTIFIIRRKTSFGLYVRITFTISRIYSSFIYKPRSGIAKFSLVFTPIIRAAAFASSFLNSIVPLEERSASVKSQIPTSYPCFVYLAMVPPCRFQHHRHGHQTLIYVIHS